MELKYYPQARCVEFPNGLVLYLGSTEADDDLERNPWPFYDMDEANSYCEIDEEAIDFPEAMRETLESAIDALEDYLDSDDACADTSRRLDEATEAYNSQAC